VHGVNTRVQHTRTGEARQFEKRRVLLREDLGQAHGSEAAKLLYFTKHATSRSIAGAGLRRCSRNNHVRWLVHTPVSVLFVQTGTACSYSCSCSRERVSTVSYSGTLKLGLHVHHPRCRLTAIL
jgi:hypothetical protein